LDAAISHDGKLVTFLSDRAGVFDVWLSQVGGSEPVNLTNGAFPGLLNPIVRNVGFSRDAGNVWLRMTGPIAIGKPVKEDIWLMPVVGGAARPFLDNAITVVWSLAGDRIAYHEASPGNPIFIADPNGSNAHRISIDKPGIHCHFLMWSPDGRYLYFARGYPVDQMDIWRLPSSGGAPERITRQNSFVAYPVFLDARTLLYVATADDGSGPWLYAIDVDRRMPHRVNVGVEQYLSLSASAAVAGQPRRLAATVANPISALWSVPLTDQIVDDSAVSRFAVSNAWTRAPRFGSDYVIYLASTGGPPGLWKWKNDAASELWRPEDGAVTAAPAISPDGNLICFPVRRHSRNTLYMMTAQGTNVHPVGESLDVHGTVSWSPDSKWIAVSAGDENWLYKVPADGGNPTPILREFCSNPLWYSDGKFILYTGSQLGRSHPLKAVTPDGQPFPMQELWVFRIDAPCRFVPGKMAVVLMQGEFRNKNFFMLDLATGSLRQLTNFKPGFSVSNFDISPDGKRILFDRSRENSDIVLIDMPVK
jgi:Tol biopolymer transport system component